MVRALEAGVSIAAKRASQPKCSAASSGVLETTGTPSRRPITSAIVLERHAFVGDRVIGPLCDALFERQPVETGGIQPVHAGPAVVAVADIGRDTLLARDGDQARNEAVIARAMGRRRKTHRGRAHAPSPRRRPPPPRRRAGNPVGGLSASVASRPGASSARPEVTSIGRSDPSSTAPIASIARLSSAQFSTNFEKSWLKAVWITASALARAVAQAFQILERAAMDLGAHGGERLGSGLGAGETEHLMA